MRFVVIVFLLFDVAHLMAARPEELALERVVLELPGRPVDLIPADLNGDRFLDLLVVVTYTDWGEITENHLYGDMPMIEVVPALFDNRELWSFVAVEGGGYAQAAPPIELPTSVAAIVSGRGLPAFALTDKGLSVVQLESNGLILTSVHEEPPVTAGVGSYFPDLNLARDINGDGLTDLLYPGREGLGVLLGSSADGALKIVRLQRMPGDLRSAGRAGRRVYPLPATADIDGDGTLDFVVRGPADNDDEQHWWYLRGLGGCRFGRGQQLSLKPIADGSLADEPPNGSAEEREKKPAEQVVFVGDLDGEGPAEFVTRVLIDSDEQMSQLRVYRINADGEIDAEPVRVLEIEGEPMGGAWPDFDKGGFEDLDGDGRIDLVTVKFDVSALQIARAVMTKKITVKLEYRVWAQGADLQFSEVQDSRFKQKLKLDLNDLRLGRLGHFGGDFDGDGRIDFVRMGLEKKISIHRGRDGARYPAKPDLEIELDTAPEDLSLLRILDLDGDDRSDVVIVHEVPAVDGDVSRRSRVELLLSGGVR